MRGKKMERNNREIEVEYSKLMNRIGNVFFGELGYKNAQNYIRGLIGSAERKNGWQLSEYIGEKSPEKLQQFIYRGSYSADALRDELRGYVAENIGEEDGVMVVDDTGFIKQGVKSCGVQRQYTGTLGKICNCQIGVFLTYASSRGHSPIDRRLYIPESWLEDRTRSREAGIPEDTKFQTKPKMALEMIQEATAALVPYTWVTGDCAYGDYDEMRNWLEENGKCYVLNISSKEYIDGFKIGNLLYKLPADGWFEASCGRGSKGERIYDWQIIETSGNKPDGFKRVILVRRSKSEPEEMKAYIAYAPNDTPDLRLVEVAGTRWTVETCFKESKGEVGLDHYEVRSYTGWYNHITFSLLAMALLTVLSSKSLDTKTFAQHDPKTKSLDDFKRGRNLPV
jgi:SRSO17 transposase